MRNLPNQLTLSRIYLSVIFIVTLLGNGPWARTIAFAVFVAACLTDLFDGRLARRRNAVSDFGKMMDPIADKVLLLVAFAGLWFLRILPGWMLAVLIAREILVTVFRLVALRHGKVIPAQIEGKAKTLTQMLCVILVLASLAFREIFTQRLGIPPTFERSMQGVWLALMGCCLLVAVFSGMRFVWKNRSLVL